MLCIRLPIPPIPQLTTVGHSLWRQGNTHFERNFQVYDLIFVVKGTLYIEEAGERYAIGTNQLLTLEAGKTHRGYQPCTEQTEIYWVHFVHPYPGNQMAAKDIPWTTKLPKGTDDDVKPHEQFMYLPKYAHVDNAGLWSTLDAMLKLHSRFTENGALQLHALLAQLLSQMQAIAASDRKRCKSYQISLQVQSYLKEKLQQPFSAAAMQQELGLHMDYLSRCLKKHTGRSPLVYLYALRMEQAKKLLLQTDLAIPAIAEQVGIPDYNYFIRTFRKDQGMPPGVYRREYRGLV